MKFFNRSLSIANQVGTSKVREMLQSYKQYAEEMSFQDGLLLMQGRIVIPATLGLKMLEKVHASHQGIIKCRERAKRSVWWPGLSKHLEEIVRPCGICAKHRIQRAEPMITMEVPSRPWKKVVADLFCHKKRTFLLVVDYRSRYVEIAKLETSTTSTEVIERLKSIFARHGIPEILVSDNGLQFSSAEFAKFGNSYGFTHVTSSPSFPQSNAEAEREQWKL